MVDPTAIDTSCAPCRDFYSYANGSWLRRTTLRTGQPFLIPLQLLAQRSNGVVESILETDVQNLRSGALDPNSMAAQPGILFASCMDTATITRAGYGPLRPSLDTIAAIRTAADLARAFAIAVGGVGQRLAPFWATQAPDPRDSKSVVVNLLGGPVVSPLFLNPKARTDAAAAAYIAESRRRLMSLGVDSAQAEREARSDFSLDEALGRTAPSVVELSDPLLSANRLSFDQLTKLMPHFAWRDYYHAMGIPEGAPLNMVSPKYYRRLDSLFATIPLDDWRAHLRLTLLEMVAVSRLPDGAARARACAGQVSNRLGRAVAREYAEKELTPAAQQRLDRMVDNIVAVLRDRIQHLGWMSASTQREALTKLAHLRRHLGAPANTAPYTGLRLRQDDYYGNLAQIEAYLQKENWATVGKRVDPEVWRMLPQVASAGYWPASNEIGVPVAILHPPYFDPSADDAANYGALGVVIGHELTHAFDNEGRRYDGTGTLRDWWTAEDDAKYTVRTKPLVAQFDAYPVVDSVTHVNGEQTLNENIADLGGVVLAFDAFRRATHDQPRMIIDGFTPEQRFFIAFAQAYADQRRPEALQQQVFGDSHAPSQWRVNGVLSNLPEFAKAWGCKFRDPMVRPPAMRVVVW
jgi:Predicted metalloendopeptidase